MSDTDTFQDDLKREVYELADACRHGDASSADTARLRDLVCNNSTARRWYVEFIYDCVSLRRRGSADAMESPRPLESGTVDPVLLAAMQRRQQTDARRRLPSTTTKPPPGLTVPRGKPVAAPPPNTITPGSPAGPSVPGSNPIIGFLRTSAEIVSHPILLWSFVGVAAAVLIGMLFWRGPAEEELPVAKGPPAAAGLAAQPVSLGQTTDARWDEGFAPAQQGPLEPGRRLRLIAGFAELKFPGNAKVVLEGPADFKVVDGDTCWLQFGRLTAHVAEAAHGFEVLTPTAHAVDLGTEFGVWVRGNWEFGIGVSQTGDSPKSEIRNSQSAIPSTEVHVFRGKVEVTESDQLAQTPPDPKSQIENRKSKILTAGEAADVTANEIKPLPAADPFQFALDKLNGRPRQVLLTEDFEGLDRGPIDESKAHWVVRGAVRKGQGVGVIDPAERLAALGAPLPEASGGKSPISNRAVSIAFTGLPPNAPPLLGHEIDGRELARRCHVLVEFDIMPESRGITPSLAIGSAVGPGAEIALWKDVDKALPLIEWTLHQWYRVRVLMDVADGAPRDIRVERLQWHGKDGWARDVTFKPPLPKVDWSTPPRYVVFGFPQWTPQAIGGIQWLDNIRVEVISEK